MIDTVLAPLRRVADFSGRSRRREFWTFWLIQSVVYGLLMAAAGEALFEHAFIWFLWLALLPANLSLTVRRLHDLNARGLWVALPWIAAGVGGLIFSLVFPTPALQAGNGELHDIYSALGRLIETVAGVLAFAALPFLAGQVVLLIMAALPGTRGANRYGSPPGL